MKLSIVVLCLILSACATRHAPDTGSWFADCYNKKRQEELLAKAEAQLGPDDTNAHGRIRKMYWDLQRECK